MNIALDQLRRCGRRTRWSGMFRGVGGAARPSARGRTLVFRTRGRRDDPGRIRAARPFSRRTAGSRTRAPDRRLSPAHPGRSRRLAALPRRRLRHERQRQGLFRPEDDRRRSRGAAHAPRARSDPRPRRRGEEQRLHALPAGALRRRFRGAAFRRCRSRSCCCRAGFPSISTRSPIGRARCSSRSWCCRR